MEPQTSNVPDLRAPQSAAAMQQPNLDVHEPQTQPLPSLTARSAAPAPDPVQPEEEASVEQRWINKANEIILHTKDDPFTQSRLLAELKTQYLAARYGRVPKAEKIKL